MSYIAHILLLNNFLFAQKLAEPSGVKNFFEAVFSKSWIRKCWHLWDFCALQFHRSPVEIYARSTTIFWTWEISILFFLVNDRAKEFSYLKHVSNYLQINYMWNITDNKIWYLIKNYRHLWHIYDVFFENFFESFSIKLSEKNIYFFSIYKFFTARSTTIFWTWEVFILSRVYKLFFTSH